MDLAQILHHILRDIYMMETMHKILAFILMTLTLAGCGSKWMNSTFYSSEIILDRDFAPYGPQYNPAPLYCYKTIGVVECYKDPQPHRARQFVAAYTPPPVKIEPNDGYAEDKFGSNLLKPISLSPSETTYQSFPSSPVPVHP